MPGGTYRIQRLFEVKDYRDFVKWKEMYEYPGRVPLSLLR